jgi:subtilisin family serine protease
MVTDSPQGAPLMRYLILVVLLLAAIIVWLAAHRPTLSSRAKIAPALTSAASSATNPALPPNIAQPSRAVLNAPGPRWTNALIVAQQRKPTPDRNELRTTVLSVPELRFPVRVEEVVRPDNGSDRLISRLEMAAGHVLAQLKADIHTTDLLAAFHDAGVVAVHATGRSGTVRLELADATPQSVPTALAALQVAPQWVEYAEPDYVVHAQVNNPNDPAYSSGDLWGLRNVGQSGGTSDADIDADEAWDIRTDASAVLVAVVDTGIRSTHQDLAANMWTNPGEIPGDGIDNDNNGVIDDVHGYNAINESGDPNDDHGHGTHVAGTIGAQGNNGVGVVGVAWRVRLLAAKFLSSNGSGFVSDGAEAIDYARTMGAQIMNNSWGGTAFSQSLSNAIERARQAGIIFVASAGNDGASSDLAPRYPAAYPHDNIVSVASSTRTDELSSFSNYGLRTVDLAAPGSAIYSTYNSSDSAYATLSGTSMASPHVSGALAVIKAQFPNATYAELIDRLLATADHPAGVSQRTRSQGRLNLARALSAATIIPLPSIVDQPRSLSVVAGAAATFTVTAQGGAPLGYQWRRNGFEVPGATAASLTLNNVQSTNAGRYTVLVSNVSGLALSEEAVLVVALPVTIVTQPQGATLPVDADFATEVRVTGDAPISYQWRRNGTNLPGETTASFRIYGVTTNDGGAYSVLVSNSVSSVLSATATLAVVTAPTFTLPPLSQTAVLGDSVTFAVAAEGSTPLAFQWFKNGVAIPGAVSSILTLNNLQASAAGSYAARVTNRAGLAWSLPAALALKNSAGAVDFPQITQHPASQTVNAGATVSFGAAATPGDVTYQWLKNGTNVAGATSSTLAIPNVSITDAAVYVLIASNAQGRAASREARLTIRQPPSIVGQPQSTVAVPGSQVVLEVTATGTEPLSYQWSKDGQPLSGATGHRLFLTSVGASQTGTYSVTVSNLAGSVVSSPATVSLTTTEITRWRQLDPGLDMQHQHCVGGAPDGIYVGGSDGALSFSGDGGRTWERRRAVGMGRQINGVAYANGRYIAIGTGFSVEINTPFSLTSSDGITWTRHSPNVAWPLTRSLRHDGSLFYTLTYDSFLTSSDGINWATAYVGSPKSLNAVIYGAGRYVAVGGSGVIYTSTNRTSWVLAPTATTQTLWAVCYDATAGFVAVGENGAIVTSPDGLTWTFQPQVTSQRLNGVAFGNGRYVAAGGSFFTGAFQEAVTLVSTNGISWRRTPNHAVDNLTTVEFANGLFVAVGGSGHVFTSEDGETWIDRRPPDSQRLYGIAQGNGVFVAVGDEGVIRNSQDGLTWVTEREGRSEELRSIGFGAGRFVAGAFAGTLYVTTDGDNWQYQTTGAGVISCIRYFNGRFFVLTDSGEILTSSDTATWRLAPTVTGAPLKHIAWNGSRYVIVGYDGTILTSTDGQNWAQQLTPTRLALHGVAWGGGQFVAVGLKGTVLTSPDGLSWTPHWAGTNASLAGLAYQNGLFVAVGEQGIVLTSRDVLSWAQQTSGTGQYFDRVEVFNGRFVATCGGSVAHSADGTNWMVFRSNILKDVAFGNGFYLGVGPSGRVGSSTDLTFWSPRSLGSLTSYVLTDVKFLNGQFVACGRSGNILTSTDGKNWTSRNWNSGIGLEELAYGAGRYVAVGYLGRILHSADAITWSLLNVPGVDQWNGVVFSGGQFVAVGWPGGIATSPDGINWTRRNSPSATQWQGVAYGNGTYVAVGFSGEVLVSTDAINWVVTFSHGWRIGAVVFSGGQFIAMSDPGAVLTSSDGLTWTVSEGDTSLYINGLLDYRGATFGVGDYGLITVAARPPEIITQPVSQQLRVGSTASLTLAVTNVGITRYQWFKNGQPLANDTGSSLSWPRVGPADAGEYFVRVSGLGGSIDSIRAVLTVTTQPFDTWRIANFGEGAFLDPSKENSVWGALADPDGDRRPNLMEYAHGSSPIVADLSSHLAVSRVNGRLRVTFTRRTDDSTLTLTPQVSGDLVTWNGGPASVREILVVPLSPSLERVTVEDIGFTGAPTQRFLRILIQLND